ncbi:54S ribosomal protein L6 mitochondrial [Vermiconidia calcicola]|uniref:54S ribosomal protein L6 mitochondrial n=1 Tax=Vermiconidia calcicola TaxID=1690605 RepID=A0ACC3MDU7_9PEZI|nr:54S ribosomal protein L6 mitochondrial [Vermiconidia calcicola]
MASSIRCTRSSGALRSLSANARAQEVTLPAFLVPAFAAPPLRAHFATSPRCHSKIGRAPLSLPPEVIFRIFDAPAAKQGRNISRSEPGRKVEIQGPLGKMNMDIPAYISIESNEESRTHTLGVLDYQDKKQKAMWGTVRAYLQNHILGVSEGHTAILRLVGVGYRATVEDKAITKQPEYAGQRFVSLKVGYSHPIELGVPKGVKASCPQPTRILLEGIEKEVVKQFAAEIRAWRKPEPYKGKGIFVNDETIRLKAKKIK